MAPFVRPLLASSRSLARCRSVPIFTPGYLFVRAHQPWNDLLDVQVIPTSNRLYIASPITSNDHQYIETPVCIAAPATDNDPLYIENYLMGIVPTTGNDPLDTPLVGRSNEGHLWA